MLAEVTSFHFHKFTGSNGEPVLINVGLGIHHIQGQPAAQGGGSHIKVRTSLGYRMLEAEDMPSTFHTFEVKESPQEVMAVLRRYETFLAQRLTRPFPGDIDEIGVPDHFSRGAAIRAHRRAGLQEAAEQIAQWDPFAPEAPPAP